MRTLFFGTPAIAVPSLEALNETTTVGGVVCQPDRPAGRGMKLMEPPVKQAAFRLGIPVIQPSTLNSAEFRNWLHEQRPDVVVVLAYGRILPSDVLRVPKHGCINLHASLLPCYRGAAPINWVLINGETRTGMSLMQMDAGLDTGPVYATRSIPIPPTMNAGDLSNEMALLGAVMVREDLPRVIDDELAAIPQDSSRATKAPILTHELTRIDFKRSAAEIVNLIRGLAPRPGAHAELDGKRVRILAAEIAETSSTGVPGTVFLADKAALLVYAGTGSIRLQIAQVEGKKALRATDLINGRVIREGQRFGVS